MRTAWTVLLAAASGVVLVAQAPPSATDLAARIQSRYATIRDFTADFTLTTTSGLSLGGGTDRGKVAVKKPVRMRWTMLTGSQNEVVSDGTTLYTYFPKDKVVHPTALSEQTSSALLLLTGRGDLVRDFVPRLGAEQAAGEWRLTLTPKAQQPDYTELTLTVDRTSLGLRGLEILDDQGSLQKFRFSNLRENQSLSDAQFTFTIPRGVEIQR